MIIPVRFSVGLSGQNFGYSIEQAETGQTYDFDKQVFSIAAPAAQIKTCPERHGNFKGSYGENLTVPDAIFSDGIYIVTLHDKNQSNLALLDESFLTKSDTIVVSR